jgi:hypothetical protein
MQYSQARTNIAYHGGYHLSGNIKSLTNTLMKRSNGKLPGLDYGLKHKSPETIRVQIEEPYHPAKYL